MTSKYDRIKSECKKKNILWEDPDFQAVQTSVFYYQTPPFTFQWKRLADISGTPMFMSDGENFDIIPGKMGKDTDDDVHSVLSIENHFYLIQVIVGWFLVWVFCIP